MTEPLHCVACPGMCLECAVLQRTFCNAAHENCRKSNGEAEQSGCNMVLAGAMGAA
jgi:hypothetical protein